MDAKQHPTRWVVVAPAQSKTFQSEEEAIDWIDNLWHDYPQIKSVTLMQVERYSTTIFRPSRATLAKRRR